MRLRQLRLPVDNSMRTDNQIHVMVKKNGVHNAHLRAFTLIELMIVVLILGALAFVAIPRIGLSTTAANRSACNANIAILNKQIELYKARTGSWPQNYTKISTDTDYFPDGPPECPFGTKYKLDAGSHRMIPHSH